MKKKRGLLFRVLKWGLLTILVVVLGFLLVVAPYWVADQVTLVGTRPRDRALTSSPADEGVAFEDVAFSASDGVPLRGWYLGGGDRGVSVVCTHGLFRSRREVLDRAIWFHQSGYNVLVMDSRRHGESGGDRVTIGFKERLDVEAGIDFVESRAPEDRVILFGVSMGAAASLLAAAERPEVEAVIADSSFLNLEQVVASYLKLLIHVPRFPLGDMVLLFIEHFGGFQKEDLDLEKAVQRIGNRPILFIGGSEDPQVPPDVQRKLYSMAESKLSGLLIVDGATHGAAYQRAPDVYQKAVIDFLARVDAARLGTGGADKPASS